MAGIQNFEPLQLKAITPGFRINFSAIAPKFSGMTNSDTQIRIPIQTHKNPKKTAKTRRLEQFITPLFSCFNNHYGL